MSDPINETEQEPITHAVLALGNRYPRHVGPIDRLGAIPLHQKVRDHTLQMKLIEAKNFV